ncbi:MAG: TonB-dependent receptor [Bacteroidota bacterium]|nr:TonB-dependent receptor [Bacteroidota bacterium]
MRRFFFTSFFSVSLFPFAFLHAQDSTGTVHGFVVDAATREPLVGASIVIPGTPFGTAAGLDGSFVLQRLPAGSYSIQASVVGYKSLILPVVAAPGRRNEIVFALEVLPIDLDAVLVEADYFREEPDVPVSAQSLSYEEIRRSPGGQEDVVRAVSVFPGVVQASAGRNDLVVRGGGASENLYVLDGVEVPNINHFGTQGATGGPLSFINLDFVRDVTFSTGGFGVRYGDKLSSLLSIDLKNGRNDRLGGKATISATQFGLNAEGPIASTGTFLFSARRSYLDFVFKAAGFGFVPEYWDLIGKASFKLDENNEFSFLAVGALDDVRLFNETADQRYNNSRILGSAQDQYVSAFSWKRIVRDGFITVALGRSFVSYAFRQSDSLLRPLFTSDSKEGETSLRADAVFLIDRSTEVSFGLQGKLMRAVGGLNTAEAPALPLPEAVVGVDVSWDTTALKGSAYAQVSRRFFERLRVAAGVRVEYFGMIEQKAVVSPRATFSYSLNPLTTLSLGIGMYHQAPSMIWVLSNRKNRGLEHITVKQVVLGVDRLLRSDTRLRLEGYLKSYTAYPVSLARPWLTMANTGAGYGGADEGFASFGFDPLVSEGTGLSRGVELLLQKRPSEVPCYGIVSLSYGKTDFTALDGVTRLGSFDQRVIVNLSGGYILDRRWEFGLKFRFGTGTPTTPFLPDGRRDVERLNSARLPAFHSLDLRVDRRWLFEGWNLITYVDVQNVYNRKNVQFDRWDYRTRSAVAVGSAIGILPSIGVSAEF